MTSQKGIIATKQLKRGWQHLWLDGHVLRTNGQGLEKEPGQVTGQNEQ